MHFNFIIINLILIESILGAVQLFVKILGHQKRQRLKNHNLRAFNYAKRIFHSSSCA